MKEKLTELIKEMIAVEYCDDDLRMRCMHQRAIHS